ncbi:MAG: hypothetical protein CBC35_01885 [Planctomycetes bacterium TMED75]|nr:hypothetical protein [Planctomycetaceae bacterium]OUU96067.1 MAG: hypothetical protein CBC35_01885 [Planctomycetes bacterium TMED75]
MYVKRSSSRDGFTIVEILVVISVIAILLGVMLVGLQGASRTSKNLRSMNRGRQVFIAWTAYSNTYADKLLPGYLSEGVQDKWRVTYPSPSQQGTLQTENTQTYPWRLMPYLDNALDPMYGYREDVDELKNDYANENNATQHAAALNVISATPEFGYNAYYVGGWWKMSGTRAHLIFGDTPVTTDSGGQVKGRLVATNLGSIRQPERTITFCTSTFRETGVYVKNEKDPDGAAWVVPPRLCETEIWNSFSANRLNIQASRWRPGVLASTAPLPQGSAGEGIEVFSPEAIPIRRHGVTVPSVSADGSTGQLGIPDLLDFSRWTSATTVSSAPTEEFSHPCDPVMNEEEPSP